MSTGDVHEGLNLAAVLSAGGLRPAVQRLGVLDAHEPADVNTCMADRVERGWGIPATRSTAATRSRRW